MQNTIVRCACPHRTMHVLFTHFSRMTVTKDYSYKFNTHPPHGIFSARVAFFLGNVTPYLITNCHFSGISARWLVVMNIPAKSEIVDIPGDRDKILVHCMWASWGSKKKIQSSLSVPKSWRCCLSVWKSKVKGMKFFKFVDPGAGRRVGIGICLKSHQWVLST